MYTYAVTIATGTLVIGSLLKRCTHLERPGLPAHCAAWHPSECKMGNRILQSAVVIAHFVTAAVGNHCS